MRERLLIPVLGLGQIVAFASSYYLLGVLADSLAADFRMRPATVFSALSTAFLLSALITPAAGRAIERFGGCHVQAFAHAAFATALVIMATAASWEMLWAGVALLGVGMGTGLYGTAFAIVVERRGADARRGITAVSLVGALGGGLGWPITRAMSEAGGFGVVTNDEEPWAGKKTTLRIEALKDRRNKIAAEHADFSTDAYRAVAKDFYTDLRETWERFVEEVLLGKTVERFNSEVKTQSLKNVVVEDSDYKTVYWAMKRVSERSGHDMAAGKNVPAPTPDDMKADLDELETFRIQVAKRGKDQAKVREALEEAPKAQVFG